MPFYPNDPAIKITSSTDVVIQNNEYIGDKQASISLDNSSQSKAIIKNNKGFDKKKK